MKKSQIYLTDAENEGHYILSHRTTIRETAKYFNVSKSKVHHDLTLILPYHDPVLATQVHELLEYNKQVRAIRGGQSTRTKYEKIREAHMLLKD